MPIVLSKGKKLVNFLRASNRVGLISQKKWFSPLLIKRAPLMGSRNHIYSTKVEHADLRSSYAYMPSLMEAKERKAPVAKKNAQVTVETDLTLSDSQLINISNILFEGYSSEIPTGDLHCLNEVQEEWGKTQLFRGKNVLVNMHWTTITLVVVKALVLAGAKVEATATPELSVHDATLKILRKAGIIFYSNGKIPADKQHSYFDFIIDCGGGTIGLTPKNGSVELTKTDEKIYKDISYPVVSVDAKSQTKEIETKFGTGDAAVRLLTYLFKNSIGELISNVHKIETAQGRSSSEEASWRLGHSSLKVLSAAVDITHLFTRHRFAVFGCGKVGKGIIGALDSAKVQKENIVVIDIWPPAFDDLSGDYCRVWIDRSTPKKLQKSIERVKKVLPGMFAVFSVTGTPGAISEYFTLDDFSEETFLINMGTEDEFGKNFPKWSVVNNKKTGNFLMPQPTAYMYLDAPFALLLKAVEELLLKKHAPGFHTVSQKNDQAILESWKRKHGEKVWQHTSGQQEVSQLLGLIRKKRMLNQQEVASLLVQFGLHRHAEAAPVEVIRPLPEMEGRPSSPFIFQGGS